MAHSLSGARGGNLERLTSCGAGHTSDMETYAVGFARPDRWSTEHPAEHSRPWHAVEAHRPPGELDGEVELAVCGAIVQVRGSQEWERVGGEPAACAECARLTAVGRTLTHAR